MGSLPLYSLGPEVALGLAGAHIVGVAINDGESACSLCHGAAQTCSAPARLRGMAIPWVVEMASQSRG